METGTEAAGWHGAESRPGCACQNGTETAGEFQWAEEQALIEVHGLGKTGGTLLNRINSIAFTNPTYSQQLERGYELLQSIGYR